MPAAPGVLSKDDLKLWSSVRRVFPSTEDATEEEEEDAAGPAARVAVAHAGAVCAATLHWLLLEDAFAATSGCVANGDNSGNSSLGDPISYRCSGAACNSMYIT